MLYYSKEIEYWNSMIRDSGDIRLDTLFTNKLNAIIHNTDDPNIRKILKYKDSF